MKKPKARTYTHFDDPLSPEDLAAFQPDSAAVGSHNFLPLLGFSKIKRTLDYSVWPASWVDFRSFVFKPDGIEVLFAPYHVASFADGMQSAMVEYRTIFQLLHPHYAAALGVGGMIMGDPPWLAAQAD